MTERDDVRNACVRVAYRHATYKRDRRKGDAPGRSICQFQNSTLKGGVDKGTCYILEQNRKTVGKLRYRCEEKEVYPMVLERRYGLQDFGCLMIVSYTKEWMEVRLRGRKGRILFQKLLERKTIDIERE